MSHQLGHAVDHDHRVVFARIEHANESRRVLAIHHVDHKHNVLFTKIAYNDTPFRITKRRAEVISRHTQVQRISAIDLALRILQRRQQTRTNIQNRYVHATPSSWSSKLRPISRSFSKVSASMSQYPRPFASSRRCTRACAEYGFRSRKRSSIDSSNKKVFATSE